MIMMGEKRDGPDEDDDMMITMMAMQAMQCNAMQATQTSKEWTKWKWKLVVRHGQFSQSVKRTATLARRSFMRSFVYEKVRQCDVDSNFLSTVCVNDDGKWSENE